MHIVLASRNQKKIAELNTILSQTLPGIVIHSLDEVGFTGDIEENGTTFEENARIKASAAMKAAVAAGKTDWCGLGDDSGLVVDALNGAPGVYSARYAGVHGDDEANNDLLLRNLSGLPAEERTARFVCFIVCVFPDGREIVVCGTCEGRITETRMGKGGFGYDPLFYVPSLGKTFSEATAEEKNALSHRGWAVHALADELRNMKESGDLSYEY